MNGYNLPSFAPKHLLEILTLFPSMNIGNSLHAEGLFGSLWILHFTPSRFGQPLGFPKNNEYFLKYWTIEKLYIQYISIYTFINL